MNAASYRIIAGLLEARTGQQLTENRLWRIGSALSGVFREYGISNVDQLVVLLTNSDSDVLANRVVEALLNNETYFFRDRAMFELLSQRVLPDLARKRGDTKRLSIWSAGCSTGQEALSLAMLFEEQSGLWKDWSIDIVGTDISGTAIGKAQRARYSQFEIQRGLSVSQMIGYFKDTGDGWVPQERIRRMVRFKTANLFEPPLDMRRHDLVLCRNVLLYFDEHRRKLAFDRLASAMHPDSWLMLGAGETVVGRTKTFRPADGNKGLYERSTDENPDKSASDAALRKFATR